MTQPVITTERLTLRRPEPDDLELWTEFFLSPRGEYIRGEATPGLAWRAFATILGHWQIHGYGLFVITDTASGKTLGAAGPWNPGDWPEPETGWTIWDPAAEGQGIAYEASLATRRYIYTELRWPRIVSYIAFENKRSAALAERLGCVLDQSAAHPPGKPCFVYRHPGPEAVL
ncbi:MAG: GNAT family N-acetyltransferase [Mangrovicoccus sp.]